MHLILTAKGIYFIYFSSNLISYPAKECIKGINPKEGKKIQGALMLLTSDISHCYAAQRKE